MDYRELGNIFRGYDLNENNILDFMILEDGDSNKYLLKLYLISLMEEYKHTQRLAKYVLLLPDEFPTMEIILKSDNKVFWESLSKIPRYFWRNYYYHSDLVISLFKARRKYHDTKQQYDNSSTRFEKLNLKKQLKESLKDYNFQFKIFKKTLKIKNKREIQNFIDVFSKYEEKAYLENKDTGKENYQSSILGCLESIADSYEMIWRLKRDLIFSYNFLCTFFSKDFLVEDDLSKLLYNIRKKMREFEINGMPQDSSDGILLETYRTHNLSHKTKFFSNTTDYEDIETEMSKLFDEYNGIMNLKNDKDYILECYKFTQKFLQIHPYGNGNGRTSKYLFYILLLKRNILPFTITDSNYLPKCYVNNRISDNYIFARQNIMCARVEPEIEQTTAKRK